MLNFRLWQLFFVVAIVAVLVVAIDRHSDVVTITATKVSSEGKQWTFFWGEQQNILRKPTLAFAVVANDHSSALAFETDRSETFRRAEIVLPSGKVVSVSPNGQWTQIIAGEIRTFNGPFDLDVFKQFVGSDRKTYTFQDWNARNAATTKERGQGQ